MEDFFDEFRSAYKDGSGYKLSMTLSPTAPASNPERLQSFLRSTNYATVNNDFKREIIYHAAPFQLIEEEADAWVDIYVAYWKAIGEILGAETANKSNIKVSEWFTTYFCLIEGFAHYSPQFQSPLTHQLRQLLSGYMRHGKSLQML